MIIPAFNEEESLPGLIRYLKKLLAKESSEILVIDGGSTDRTVELCAKAGAKVITSDRKGRSKQMNVGSQHAKGDVLYFLHADTRPPSSFVDDINEAIKKGFGAGCFRLSFDDLHPVLRFYAWFTRFDVNLFRFGDQSLFVKNKTFEQVGGFDEQLIVMEDQVIVKNIKEKSKFAILKKPVITSARKYRMIGVLKLQIIFTMVVVMFYLGIDQQKIARFYKGVLS